MRSLSLPSNEERLQEMLNKVDTDGDKTLDLNEFITLITRSSNNSDVDLKAAFDNFDKDGDGYITAIELKEAMESLGR